MKSKGKLLSLEEIKNLKDGTRLIIESSFLNTSYGTTCKKKDTPFVCLEICGLVLPLGLEQFKSNKDFTKKYKVYAIIDDKIELERKFIVKPEYVLALKKQSTSWIACTQTYLSLEPELRIRKNISVPTLDSEGPETKYYLTTKSKNEIGRNESEFEISQTVFNELYTKRITGTILKSRYLIPLYNNLIAEMDVYEDFKDVIVEVEFDDEVTANFFVPPEWFDIEVTNDKSYSNKSMASELPIK